MIMILPVHCVCHYISVAGFLFLTCILLVYYVHHFSLTLFIYIHTHTLLFAYQEKKFSEMIVGQCILILDCEISCQIVIVGEVANFVAYVYAPAVLVTPLGALSIIIR